MDKLETFFSVSEELSNFLLCLLIGAVLGIFYDIIRTFRVIIPHNSFFVAIGDIAFILLWGIELLVFSVEQGRGIIRFYFILGNILGFSIYLLTLGNLIISVIRKVSALIRKFFKIIFSPLIKCFAFLRQIVSHIFVKNRLKYKKTYKKT